MIHRSFITTAALAAALALAGCRSANHDDADDADDARTQEISLAQVPPKVKAGFDKAFPGATVDEVEKETYSSGLVHYEFEFTTSDGRKTEVELDEDGEVLPEH